MDEANREDPGITQELALDRLCLEFEESLRRHERPSIAGYLERVVVSLRPRLFELLLEIEVEHALHRGIPFDMVAVRDEFPEHGELVGRVANRRNYTLAQTESPSSDNQGHSTPSASSLHGRFEPGQRVAGRYRIVSLLGKGGMGEVYRADDLVLGQSVALKFLPEGFANDSKRLEYFFSEVRLARQVSHPNVCRVHDIGEVDGQHFISMEFIDGEDLKTLLKRTGRPQHEKAVEWARQLCSGLAAAHDQGVLHRDLKPANVMIDGRGQVRITDFGLATVDDDENTQKSLVGTPAYMAPEQISRGSTSVQSDIYSLGLVLFEMFAGVSARDANRKSECESGQSRGSLSGVVKDVDPAIENIVSLCLRHASEDRPKTAAEVQMALPGANLLAAEVAAGRLPSPKLVAASGATTIGSPKVVFATLAVLLVGIVGNFLLAPAASWTNLLDQSMHPEHLKVVARQVVAKLGYEQDGGDDASGFAAPYAVSHGIPDQFQYWYRHSPTPIVVTESFGSEIVYSQVKLRSPAWANGEVGVRLAPETGKLRWFRAKPIVDSFHEVPQQTKELDPVAMGLTEDVVGFDFSKLSVSTDRQMLPEDYASDTKTWHGHWPETGEDFFVCVGVTGNHVSYFEVRRTTTEVTADVQENAMDSPGLVLVMVAWWGAAALMLRNLALGHGDRKGAFRLAVFWMSAVFLIWLCQAHHVPSMSGEWTHFVNFVHIAGGSAFVMCTLYLAVEPFVRRKWPELLIGWTSVLQGSPLNPRVGHEILVGLAAGTIYINLCLLCHGVWAGQIIPGHSYGRGLNALGGSFSAVSWVFEGVLFRGMYYGLVLLAAVILFRIVFRTKLFTGIVCTVLLGLIYAKGLPTGPAIVRVVVGSVLLIVLLRCGLLSCMALAVSAETLIGLTTLNADAFYFRSGLGVGISVFAVGCLAAWIWLGAPRPGRPNTITAANP